jgi:hypothetical protein
MIERNRSPLWCLMSIPQEDDGHFIHRPCHEDSKQALSAQKNLWWPRANDYTDVNTGQESAKMVHRLEGILGEISGTHGEATPRLQNRFEKDRGLRFG